MTAFELGSRDAGLAGHDMYVRYSVEWSHRIRQKEERKTQ